MTMKAVALHSTPDSEPARKHPNAAVHNVPVSPWFIRPASAVDGPLVQRKSACACGGDCPRCQDQPLQTKLGVSQPGDALEREADDVADKVMRMAGPAPIGSAPATIQRHASLAREIAPGEPRAPAIVDDVLRSPGEPLNASAREFMEPRFEHDFSTVRVHTDCAASESADAVNARAYTYGHHIVFAAGQYQPGSPSGRRLLAHELAHTSQQGIPATAASNAGEYS
jgi:hypothetical protein